MAWYISIWSIIGRMSIVHNTEWDDILYVPDNFVKKESQYIRDNDILISMANSRELVGKVAIVRNLPFKKTTFGGFIAALRTEILNQHFLTYILRSPRIREKIINSASQTTNIANISIGKLNPMLIPIPPLAEQHRIVAKVDELMALCGDLQQSLNEAQTTQMQLTNAVVENAF